MERRGSLFLLLLRIKSKRFHVPEDKTFHGEGKKIAFVSNVERREASTLVQVPAPGDSETGLVWKINGRQNQSLEKCLAPTFKEVSAGDDAKYKRNGEKSKEKIKQSGRERQRRETESRIPCLKEQGMLARVDLFMRHRLSL